MIQYYSSLDQIIADFDRNGISIDKPGFYDERAFLAVEENNPAYLNNYSRFVQLKEYSPEYLEQARSKIPRIAKILHEELVKDGRTGACVDVSLVLSRILEKEGLWNYIVKGALTIDFPEELGIERKYFWPIDITPVTGHAWVYAPPFYVVDLTVKQQPYFEGEQNFLPDFVISETNHTFKASVSDIFSTNARRVSRISERASLKSVHPKLAKFVDTFKPTMVKHEGTQLKYIQVAASAPDAPLEKINSLRLNGFSGYDIYIKKIQGQI